MNESNASATISSATIIPFPRRTAAQPAPAIPPADQPVRVAQDVAENPALRLRRALDLLESALAEQRTAVADWRGAMAELNGSVHGLGQSLRTYQQALEQLKGRVTR
jgi:hypothetical protein